jgi:hypothetical protein
MGVDESVLWDWVVFDFDPWCWLWEGFRHKRFGPRWVGHLALSESLGMQSGLVASVHALFSGSGWQSLRFRMLPQGDIVQAASSTNICAGIAKRHETEAKPTAGIVQRRTPPQYRSPERIIRSRGIIVGVVCVEPDRSDEISRNASQRASMRDRARQIEEAWHLFFMDRRAQHHRPPTRE